GAGGDERWRIIGRGIGEGDRASDRAHVAHRRVRDFARRIAQDRERAGKARGLRGLAVARHRADAPAAARGGRHAGERGDAGETHDRLGLGEVRIHHRHQRGAAGKAARAVDFGQDLRGGLDRGGAVIAGDAHGTAVASIFPRKVSANLAPSDSAFFFITPSPNLPSRPVTDTSETYFTSVAPPAAGASRTSLLALSTLARLPSSPRVTEPRLSG